MLALRRTGSVLARLIPYNLGLWRFEVSLARPRLAKRYSSVSDKSETARLPDGRNLGFIKYGVPSGHPIFYLHGLPGSRLEGHLWNQEASALGATIISLDRPGIGLSSPNCNRTLLSYAEDIRHLAKQLGYQSYSLMGVSGGGPYALACAHSHTPESLRSVTLVCGMGPYGIDLQKMRLGNRVLFYCFQHFPWVVRLVARISAAQLNNPKLSDDAFVEVLQKKMSSRFRLNKVPSKDLEILSDTDTMKSFLASTREHFRQGTDAWMDEFRLVTSPAGFDLGAVRVPVQLWYGRQDINVPLSIGEEIARRLPAGVAEMHVEDETHISLVVNCRRRVLEDVLSRV